MLKYKYQLVFRPTNRFRTAMCGELIHHTVLGRKGNQNASVIHARLFKNPPSQDTG